MRATLSVLGLEYFKPDMWDSLVIPEDMTGTGFRKDDLVDLIRAECAELEVAYAEPETFCNVMAAWSRSQAESWTRMWRAIREEYNPLHNFDRYEEMDDETDGTTSGTVASTGDVRNKRAGWNDGNSLTDADETTSKDSSTTSGKTAGKAKHRGHLYGNIGVTTSAQMLDSEINVRMRNNMTQIILRQFSKRFCLLVY